MRGTPIVIALGLILPASVHAANEVCAQLSPQRFRGRVAIAPIICEPALAADCASISEQIVRCMQSGSAKILTPEGVRASMSENVLQQIQGAPSSKLMDFAGALGASHIVVTQVNR